MTSQIQRLKKTTIQIVPFSNGSPCAVSSKPADKPPGAMSASGSDTSYCNRGVGTWDKCVSSVCHSTCMVDDLHKFELSWNRPGTNGMLRGPTSGR